MACLASRVFAAGYTYTLVDGANDSWSTGTNWSPSAPVSDSAATLTLAPASTFTSGFTNTTTNDLGAFQLATLNLSGNAPASGSPITITVDAANNSSLNFAAGTINVSAVANGTSLTYNLHNPLNFTSSLTINKSGGSNLELTAPISGNGGLSILSTDSLGGTVSLSDANTYTGATTVKRTTLHLTSDAALGTGSGTDNLVFGGSKLLIDNSFAIASSRSIKLISGVVDPTPSSVITTFDVAQNVTLTYAGVISEGSNGPQPLGAKISKSGPGTLLLAGPGNSFTGTTQVLEGTLAITSEANLGTSVIVTVSGATLSAAQSLSTDRRIILGSSISPAAGGSLRAEVGQTLTCNGMVNTFSSVSGNFYKEGPGIVVLNGFSSFGGGTYINDGTLIINGTTSANVASNVTLNAGILGGHSHIWGKILAGSGPHTIAPSATLPETIATTLQSQGLTTDANTTFLFNLLADGSSDLLNTGATTLNGGAILLNDNNVPQGYYKILQFSGSLGGQGASSLSIATTAPTNMAYLLDTQHDPGFIDIHKVLLGDANADNIVDGADFDAWFTHLGQSATNNYANGDLNSDGVVDGGDFDLWFTHLQNTFGSSDSRLVTINSGLAAVPEPASLAILLPSLVVLLPRKRTP